MSNNFDSPIEIGFCGAVPSATARPTPETIDELARRHQEAKAAVAVKLAEFQSIEEEAIAMVRDFGIVPPHAEKSRRLIGRLAQLTVTKSDAISIDDARVRDLRESLDANGRNSFFTRLFAERTKYELVEGAEDALKAEPLPKRLSERVLNMFGRCFKVKPKKPSLKVDIVDPVQPARKPRSRKVVSQ